MPRNRRLNATDRSTKEGYSWKKELTNEFSAVLQKGRQDLSRKATLILSKNEKELRKRLDETQRSFIIDPSHLNSNQKNGRLLGSSGDANNTLDPISCHGGNLERERALGLVLKDLKHNYRSHRRELKKIWKNWHKVQREIACLGSEVLSSSRFDVVQNCKQKARGKELRAVTPFHKASEKEKTEHDSFIFNETEKIKDMSRKAIAKAKAQTKASRVEKHKRWEAVGDLARRLVTKNAH